MQRSGGFYPQSCHCKIAIFWGAKLQHSQTCLNTFILNDLGMKRQNRKKILIVFSCIFLNIYTKEILTWDRISPLLWKNSEFIIRRPPGKLLAHQQIAEWCSNHRMLISQEILFLVSSEARQSKRENELHYTMTWKGTVSGRDSKMSPAPAYILPRAASQDDNKNVFLIIPQKQLSTTTLIRAVWSPFMHWWTLKYAWYMCDMKPVLIQP